MIICHTRHFIDSTMKLIAILLFFVSISPSFDCSIIVYNSEDRSSVQDYDCIDHQSTPYCRRLSQPMPLQRENDSHRCYHNGTSHSFRSLRSDGVTVHTVLRKWRSTLERVDRYAHYLRQPLDAKEGDTQLCQCLDPQSFGKNCEYKLPLGNTVSDVVKAKFSVTSGKLMYVGEIVCYSTLKCDFGLLCLDWRDICDGVQQCMFGLDEENCDKLEFNECEEDEYRCMNGMCIPDEYFLDGDYDCMDMSDEKGPFNNTLCPYHSASVDCDDRVCPPNRWSCGDGQCIIERIFAGTWLQSVTPCLNRRDQFFWCERADSHDLWTQENGRCSDTIPEPTGHVNNYCFHLLLCAQSWSQRKNCPCLKNKDRCRELYGKSCDFGLLRYPDGGLLAPYAFEYFNVGHTLLSFSPIYVWNGTIKCRGHLASCNETLSDDFFYSAPNYIESLMCSSMFRSFNFSDAGHHPHCHNDSRTFNNHSYHWIAPCNDESSCISAYRINDGFVNCATKEDEKNPSELVFTSCSTVQRHRFRCSIEQASCLPPIALADLPNQCIDTNHELSRVIQIGVWKAQCNTQLKKDCSLLRRLIESSWNHSLHNVTSLQGTDVQKIPFRNYCDTFQDLPSNQDENSAMCQYLWTCVPEQWKCHSGQCIDYTWVLDGKWDCFDGSDEETIFAVGFNQSHPNYKWLIGPSLIGRFEEKYGDSWVIRMCDAAIAFSCFTRNVSRTSNRSESGATRPPTLGHSNACVPEYDLDYVVTYCFRTFIAIKRRSKCALSNWSTVSEFNFRKRCSIGESPTAGFQTDRNPNLVLHNANSTCWDGTVRKQSRCNSWTDCPNHEDEFLCGQEKFTDMYYRAEKQYRIRQKEKEVKLLLFPAYTDRSHNSNQSTSDNLTRSTLSPNGIRPPQNLSSILNWCNRGIPIWTSNHSFVCFCPPQYHGDQCQFHSDRLTFLTHVDYTESNYTTSTDPSIVHKFLVLFLSNDQVISWNEFHTRPGIDVLSFQKKLIHLHYSRSAQHMQKKQERYFNRSSITNDHPFSVLIEAYEMKSNLRSRRFAVWRYPIHFDYLPVHRLATILRFLRQTPDDADPCLKIPCEKTEECYRVQNQKSQHLCLQNSSYFVENRSHSDPRCGAGYCSLNAICLPKNGGLMNGQDLPYCICPHGYMGQRCGLFSGKCAGKSCQNGGHCNRNSKLNEFECECTEEYQGETCEQTKSSIHIRLSYTAVVTFQVIVVQYLKIDFISLELNIVGQAVYGQLPQSLAYYHDTSPVPEIVLLKLYHVNRSDIYVLSLHTAQSSIRTHTSLLEHNRCKAVQSFLSTHQRSVIRYHHVCRMHPELLCFFDDIYLCICETNHTRAECFNYDHSTDTCDRCLANGRCVKERNEHDFHCMCAACHEGRFCHFNLESMSITLDQLLSFNLLSSSSLIRHATYYALIAVPPVVFLIGLLNNLCAFVTFRRPRCLRNGIGHYLFAMSICNQLTLAFLALRLIHLSMNISAPHQSFRLDGVLCKTSNYLLTTSTELTYWLSSLVAVERVYVALFINGQWLNKPRIARRILALTVVSILGVSAYQLLVTHSHVDRDDENNAMCTVTFPADSANWLRPRGLVTAIGSVGPFAINLICTMAIICLVTQKKMNATRGRNTGEPFSHMLTRIETLSLTSYPYS